MITLLPEFWLAIWISLNVYLLLSFAIRYMSVRDKPEYAGKGFWLIVLNEHVEGTKGYIYNYITCVFVVVNSLGFISSMTYLVYRLLNQ